MTASARLAGHVGDGFEHALAAVALRIAVAHLVRFVNARAGAGGHDGPPDAAVFEAHLYLDGGVAAGVQHLQRVYRRDAIVCHGRSAPVSLALLLVSSALRIAIALLRSEFKAKRVGRHPHGV